MKGEKLYQKAKQLSHEMYEKIDLLSGNERLQVYSEYLMVLRKAAYAGHPDAQFELGMQYEEGTFLSDINPCYNPKRYFYWYTKACTKNNGAACNSLAIMYEKGECCNVDYRRALELYKKSADLGDHLGKENYKTMLKQMSVGGKYNKSTSK